MTWQQKLAEDFCDRYCANGCSATGTCLLDLPQPEPVSPKAITRVEYDGTFELVRHGEQLQIRERQWGMRRLCNAHEAGIVSSDRLPYQHPPRR